MSGRSRIDRFVGSARTLLGAQVAAAVGATALTVWAAVEVQAVIDENERLAARVAELERVRPSGPLVDPLDEIPPSAGLPVPDPGAAQTVRPEEADVPNPEVDPVADEPPPAEVCRALDGRAIDCVPPFRRFPNTGVCLDGNQQRMQCPPGVEETVAPPPPPPPPDGRGPLEGRTVTDRAIEARPAESRPPVR